MSGANLTAMEQCRQWVAGRSIHRATVPRPDIEGDGECCPDFSCCSGQPAVPKEVRELFLQAALENDERQKMRMLAMFLGQAISNKNIYIAGFVEEGT